jgi:putative transcriptional regulator
MSSELFKELSESIKESGEIRRGKAKPSRVFTYGATDIRKLRESVDVSQAQFARMIGVSKSTLQNWEQGRRHPRGPAKALLRVFQKDPRAVVRALG